MDKKMIARVFCKNPGYGNTAVALLLCAKMILTESDKMPDKGGVLTPFVAFHKTSLIKQLIENEWKFEIVKTEE